jgi:hypothetical protein
VINSGEPDPLEDIHDVAGLVRQTIRTGLIETEELRQTAEHPLNLFIH